MNQWVRGLSITSTANRAIAAPILVLAFTVLAGCSVTSSPVTSLTPPSRTDTLPPLAGTEITEHAKLQSCSADAGTATAIGTLDLPKELLKDAVVLTSWEDSEGRPVASGFTEVITNTGARPATWTVTATLPASAAWTRCSVRAIIPSGER